jgi:type III pantothenate kinase
MVLLIDAGNTRIKWAVLSSQGLGVQQADSHAGWGPVQMRARVLLPAGEVDRVVVANVGGDRIAGVIRETVQETLRLTPEFLTASTQAGGIRNGYTNPEQLGVDRWAAMIGARSLEPGPVCVVNVGTAMTVDGVDAAGRHLGGVIVPGPDLMISSLMRHTSDIAVRSQDGRLGEGLFADNTLGAVYQGAVHALVGVVDQAWSALRLQSGAAPAVLLTGGAADRLERMVTMPARRIPDLVLKGLAILAQEAPSVPARLAV